MVIPARNEQATIRRQLAALTSQAWDGEWEVVVVDNGSTDRTASIVAEMASEDPRIRLIHEETPGLCHARNAGIASARGESIAICDADDEVSDGWVAAMGGALRHAEFVTGPAELDRLNPSWVADSRGRSAASAMPTFYDLFPYPNGNNIGLHSDLVERIGWFDQDFIGSEDAEFGLRAHLAGVRLEFVREAAVHYAYRTTAKQLWRQGFGYGQARPGVAGALRAAGRPGPSPFAGWKSWAWLALNLYRAVSTEGRARLAWVAGNRFGHLMGSWRHRTLLI